jgi:hypothetical protein
LYIVYILYTKKGWYNEKKQILKLLRKNHLTCKAINALAFRTKLIRRVRTIKPVDILVYFITESLRGCLSYNDLAAKIHAETGTLASRQAYHKKMNAACLQFFQKVLAALMQAKLKSDPARSPLRQFKRVLVQDSTIIKLPAKLLTLFSGVRNAHMKVCNARLQCVYELLSGRFVKFSLDPYSKNDLSAACELKLQSGDLVLRDRGYFVLEECRRIIEAKADFISRYKHKTAFYCAETGAPVDLIYLLKKHGAFDIEVLAGGDRPIKLRLVALRVDEEMANRRRQKAKGETHGHHPGKEILFLMGWSIFVTSLGDQQLGVKELLELYGLRWRIETIFKTWKSYFHFSSIHNVGEIQLQVIVIARMIAATMFYQAIYTPLLTVVHNVCNKELSLMKVMRYISRNITNIVQLLRASRRCDESLKVIVKYCTYDTRKRPNFNRIEREILREIPLS